MAGIELDLSDIDMQICIEKGMRGGVSNIAKRHNNANNKYIKCYDGDIKNKYIMYLDASNLYG